MLRNYHTLDVMNYPSNRVVVYITDKTERFGLVDRLRTMAYAYVLAAENGRPSISIMTMDLNWKST